MKTFIKTIIASMIIVSSTVMADPALQYDQDLPYAVRMGLIQWARANTDFTHSDKTHVYGCYDNHEDRGRPQTPTSVSCGLTIFSGHIYDEYAVTCTLYGACSGHFTQSGAIR